MARARVRLVRSRLRLLRTELVSMCAATDRVPARALAQLGVRHGHVAAGGAADPHVDEHHPRTRRHRRWYSYAYSTYVILVLGHGCSANDGDAWLALRRSLDARERSDRKRSDTGESESMRRMRGLPSVSTKSFPLSMFLLRQLQYEQLH